MNRFWTFLVLFCNCWLLNAQNRLEITVLSTLNEPLQAASVQVRSISEKFSGITDESGICRFEVPTSKYRIQVRFLGFQDYSDSVVVSGNTRVSINLKHVNTQGEEVVIHGKQPDDNVQSASVGTTSLQQKEIKNLPKLLGETDAIKVLQYTPGVALTGEGNSGLYVRGGANDQNLVLLDGAPVFNPSHLLGIFSVFNTNVINDVRLYKSAIPANYGGRISSVLEIETTSGNDQKAEVQGSVGLVSSNVYFSAPAVKGKASFYMAARKCYLNALMKPVSKLVIRNSNLMFRGLSYDFYDLNGGFFWRLSDKDNLRFSIYQGKDVFGLDKADLLLTNTIDWANTASSLQWKHAFNSSAFVNASVSLSLYNFDFNTVQNQSSFRLNSDIRSLNGKLQLVKISGKHRLSAGGEIIGLTTVPTDRKADIEQVNVNFNFRNNYQTYEYAVFLNDEMDFGSRWKLSLGYRHSFYRLAGPYRKYSYNNMDLPVDSLICGSNQTVVLYQFPEIRTSVRYLIREDLSLKASLNTSAQYLNQVTTSAVSLPSDFWVPSTLSIKPQYGKQVNLGIYKNFRENSWESSAEVFYKTMSHQVEFYNSIFNTRKVQSFEDNFISGKGIAFGAEIFLKKKKGATTGWLSYTFSRTLRKFDQINDGNWYPAKYDRIHDGSLVINHTLNSRWSFSAVFIYATGEAFTVPVERYIVEGNLLNIYGEYNGYRLPAYHRLDLSATMKLKQTSRVHSELTFSVYNVYNRQNPIFLYNETKGNLDKYQLNVTPKQLALLPVLPSVSWNFSF